MQFEATPLQGAWLIRPEPHKDERGYFSRVFCEQQFSKQGLQTGFPQHSLSFNKQAHTLRGLHFQRQPHGETKLLRCSRGRIFDVIVDIRPESKTFRQYFAQELSESNLLALYVPEGFAHGFVTLEPETEVHYMISPAYVPGHGEAINWQDPALAIDWPVRPAVLSPQDAEAPGIDELF
jgi:dTDP-4-dehydrorhamnose 3,5-epimerase